MLNLDNTITNAKELAIITNTYAIQRFQDFRMRVIAAMSNAAYRGMQGIRKTIDIPFGVCEYNDQLINFIQELKEQGYKAEKFDNKLYIKWSENYQITG